MRHNLIFKKQKLKEFYDGFGRSYDTLAHTHYRTMLQGFVRREFEDAALILDAGCGTGAITSELKGLKVGLDLSPNLARIAKVKGLEVVIGDAENLPFIDGIFEAIVCTDVLEHLSNPLKALREFVRVLKPGYRVLVTTPNPIWAPFIKVADLLKLKFPEGTRRYILPTMLDRMLKEVNLIITKEDGWTFMLGWPRQLSLEQVITVEKRMKVPFPP